MRNKLRLGLSPSQEISQRMGVRLRLGLRLKLGLSPSHALTFGSLVCSGQRTLSLLQYVP